MQRPNCPPHYWIIAQANGPTSPGMCRKCRTRGEFNNFVESHLEMDFRNQEGCRCHAGRQGVAGDAGSRDSGRCIMTGVGSIDIQTSRPSMHRASMLGIGKERESAMWIPRSATPAGIRRQPAPSTPQCVWYSAMETVPAVGVGPVGSVVCGVWRPNGAIRTGS